MRAIILLFVLSLGSNTAIAECTARGMYYFPETKQISLNSMFIIQGYGLSQKTIRSFEHRTVYLESTSGETVELVLQELLIGQKELTQAIFCVSKELQPNTTYYLRYSELSESESSYINLRRYKKNEPVSWTTTNRKHLPELNADLKLTFDETSVTFYGCGPDANAVFDIKNAPRAEVWYKTELWDLTTNTKRTYYLKPWKGQVFVGHGMCSGAFTFNKTGNYKVRFTVMNTDGKALPPSEWVKFESPFKGSVPPFGN